MAVDKLVDSTQLDGYFSDIADAIRDKDGTQNTYTPAQMPQAIKDIPSGGDDVLKALLAGTASGDVVVDGVEHLGLTQIGFWDFTFGTGLHINSDITSLTFPDLLDVQAPSQISSAAYGGLAGRNSSGTYYHPAALEEIHLPKATSFYISDTGYTFQNLETFDAPVLTNIYGSLPYTHLTSINLPSLTEWALSLSYSSTLTSIILPQCTQMRESLRSNTALTEVSVPKLQTLAYGGFSNCTALTEIILPMVTNTSGYAFENCTSLECVDYSYQYIGSIYACAFYGCSSLKALIIRATNGNTSLSSTNALTGTPIAAGTGYIYVPRSLVSRYQAATNWITYSAQFRALEDYTDDGTVTGKFIMPAA